VNLLILACAGCTAAAIAWGTNWLALVPWRRSKDQHWTQRARRFHPVRVAAANNLWVLPALLTVIVMLVWPDAHPQWAWLLLATAIGAVVGTIPMDHEVFPRIPMRALLRQVAATWTMRFLLWSVFLTAIALMPLQFSWEAWAVALAVLAMCVFWTCDGWIRIGRKLGLFAPAPERLQRIVSEIAAKMNVTVREICMTRISLAQAYALPASRRLLFSERLVELLSNVEIAAVCAHELAHFTESRSQHYSRYIVWLMFLPWVLFNPVVHTLGVPGFLGLAVGSAIIPLVYRTISHRLELRADKIALAHEPDSGTYARALAKLYEDGLLPAMNPKQRASHPHLYDRLARRGRDSRVSSAVSPRGRCLARPHLWYGAGGPFSDFYPLYGRILRRREHGQNKAFSTSTAFRRLVFR